MITPDDILGGIDTASEWWKTGNAELGKSARAIGRAGNQSWREAGRAAKGMFTPLYSRAPQEALAHAALGTTAWVGAAAVGAAQGVSGAARMFTTGLLGGVVKQRGPIHATGKFISAPAREAINVVDRWRDNMMMEKLPQQWDRPWGKRITLGKAFGLGGALGMGMASFKLSAPDSASSARRVESGSAYESGDGAFGATGARAKMPAASGAMVMGMHNRR